MNTHSTVPAASRRRRLTLVSSVAALALMALAGFEAGVAVPSLPAYAETTQAPLQGSAIGAPAALAPVSFADLVQKVKPAVISVKVKIVEQDAQPMAFGRNGGGDNELPFPNLPPNHPLNRLFGPFGQDGAQNGGPGGQAPKHFGEALGSGFFISADGYAVTNNHVVAKAKTVSITTDDGKIYSAKVIGTDPKTDVALIKVDGRSDFPFVKLATASPRIGDWVLAVGNPFGLGGTVTAGIVSARGRDIGAGPYDDFLQIDAPVNRGNSGGPTFDLSGNVVGVNTAIYSPSGGSVGIAFAIPSQTVQSVVDQLKDTGSVTRGYIGVQIQPVTTDLADGLGLKDAKGALVASIAGDSPAGKAGLKAGDAILSVNGQSIADARELSRDIAALKPGDKASLSVWRDGETKTIEVAVAKYPSDDKVAKASVSDEAMSAGSKLGLSLAPASEVGKGGKGVAIMRVDPDSPAAEKGLQPGDVITLAAGKTVSTPDDVKKAVADAKRDGRKAVLLQVERDGNSHYVAVPFTG
ncbi:serine protease Do [Rhizobiales bacterium GAS191]|jgi:serine protease Do|nr:serine protease Do [Rhizobiales bacterium GAS113]SED96648.1 serine protease Do [Rhizobiales bacterium GAS188]SEE55827.1 serine protease Do [Rhizobiales bacterium GAS191]